jgi:hypothetical protein
MYKKLLFYALLVAGLVAPLGAPVAAQNTSLIRGQTHEYDVHFRGNGEAIIVAKVVFENTAEESKDTIQLGIEGDLSELYIAQLIREPMCEQYDYSNRRSTAPPQGSITPDQNNDEPVCLKYSELTPNSFLYDSRSFEYEDVVPVAENGNYSVELPKPVEPGSAGALLVVFASKSYASERLGRVYYDFPTFTAQERITTARVAVTFGDNAQYLSRGGGTDYTASDAAAPESTAASGIAGGLDIGTASIDTAIRTNIGKRGAVVEQASSLAPGDVYRVKGFFAMSWWGLYWQRVAVVILGLILVIIALYHGPRLLKNRRSKRVAAADDGQPGSPSVAADQSDSSADEASAAVVEPTEDNAYDNKLAQARTSKHEQRANSPVIGAILRHEWIDERPVYATIVLSLAVVVAAIVTIGVFYLTFNLIDESSLSYAITDTMQALLTISAMMIGVFYILALPIFMYKRLGMHYLLLSFFVQSIWLVVFVMVTLFIVAGANNAATPTPVEPIYYGPGGYLD